MNNGLDRIGWKTKMVLGGLDSQKTKIVWGGVIMSFISTHMFGLDLCVVCLGFQN